MLSDQCPWRFVVVSKFYGIVHEASGSFLGQLNDIVDVMDCMNPRMTMKGRSLPIRKFPLKSVREALVNAAIHSDLSLHGDICVEVGPDFMQVSSPGGTWETGGPNSVIYPFPRNRLLADLLRRLDMARLQRSGLREIIDSYSNTSLLPGIDRSDDMFSVVLPAYTRENREYAYRKHMLVEYLRCCRGASLRTISKYMMTNTAYTRKLLSKAEDEGEIFEMGSGDRLGYYPCDVCRKGCWDGRQTR